MHIETVFKQIKVSLSKMSTWKFLPPSPLFLKASELSLISPVLEFNQKLRFQMFLEYDGLLYKCLSRLSQQL